MPRRYLIVDDNLPLAENLAEMLEGTGAEATVAGGAREALALAKNGRFDALITDMRMPEMSGLDLMRELRQVDPGLPVLLVTAYTTDSDLNAVRRYGLLGILPKPIPPGRLLELTSAARRNGTVAIVDDDRALLENLSEALQLSGFATVTAGALSDLDDVDVSPFAAVVDLHFPGAPEGASVLTLNRRFPAVPQVIITAFPETEHGEAAAVLIKPFQVKALLETITSLYTEPAR